MNSTNKVYIATSIDGYIADKNGGIEWLDQIPNPDNDDMGFNDYMASIDALIMGRTTYETVLGFDIPWPYKKPVFVLSNSLKEVPEDLKDKVEIVNGNLKKVLNEKFMRKGFRHLYIDGGRTIQSFLEEDLIDEMTISVIPLCAGRRNSSFRKYG